MDDYVELVKFQERVDRWARRNFGETSPHQPLLGLTEEVGELAHAHLKQEQGIRGTHAEHYNAKIDAVGDIFIYLLDYCNRNGIEFAYALQRTWEAVEQRDWKRNPNNGVSA